MVSVMLCPCILCVALVVYLFVLCLTVFVNCLLKQFTICFGVAAILLSNVMAVFSVGGGICWIYRVWFSKECACDPSVHLSVPSIGFVCVFVCWKLSPHLGV